MLYNKEKGFHLEYIYDNYFQRLEPISDIVDAEKNIRNSVLRELMKKADELSARILCRNTNLTPKHWIGICSLVVDLEI